MKFNKLDKKVINYWVVRSAIDFLITLIVFGLFTYFILRDGSFNNLLNLIIILETIILVFLIAGIFIFPKLKYYWWGYILDKDKFAIRKGFIFIRTTIIPLVRIQHVAVENGPIIRKFDLNKIKISTASGTFDIEGINDEEAKNINEYLKDKLIKNNKKEIIK